MIAHVSRSNKSKRIMTILNETLLSAQMFLKSLGFRCTKIISQAEFTCDQYVFMANSHNPMNRLAIYDPDIF